MDTALLGPTRVSPSWPPAVSVAADDNPDVDSPDVLTPDVDSPDVQTPDTDSPDVQTPDTDSPDTDD